jgi:hypothetical protein
MFALVMLVSTGLIVRIRVAMESQPAELVKVAEYVPAFAYVLPFQLYGSWFEQIVAVVVLVRIEFTISSSEVIESHPEWLVSLSLYVPAAVYDLPFQVYGSWFEQMVAVVVLVRAAFTISSSVAIESHPETLVSFSLYVPAVEYVLPFQLYGSWFEQMVSVVVLVRTAFTINSSVAIESQSVMLVSFSLYVPVVEYDLPFQV